MIKKALLVGILVLLFGVPQLKAQKVYWGLVGSLNFGELKIKNAEGVYRPTSSRTLFGIGGIISFELHKNVSLHLEPMYLRKGATILATRNDPNWDLTMTFLEIPVFLKLSLGKTIRPYVLAGSTFGFLLSSKGEFTMDGEAFKGDLKDITKSLDVGLGFGVGVSFPLGKTLVFVEGRYTLGMTDLFKAGTVVWKSGDTTIPGEGLEGNEMFTKGFQVLVGFTIPLGSRS
ncbi:porin family protein [Acidobacteriota bacterium]